MPVPTTRTLPTLSTHMSSVLIKCLSHTIAALPWLSCPFSQSIFVDVMHSVGFNTYQCEVANAHVTPADWLMREMHECCCRW